MSATILLVEDEVEAAEMLGTFLELNGFSVVIMHDGSKALDWLKSTDSNFDLAILDIMVPGVDGRKLCEYIRASEGLSDVPVIFLTAKDAEQDEIHGLNLGADDYIAKPASLNLVLAHVKTLLRRRTHEKQQEYRFGQIVLIPGSASVQVGQTFIELTSKEFGLLELLFRNPKRIFSRQEILEHISDDLKYIFDRTIDVHVKNIRIKLGEHGDVIKTYRGLGYGINRVYLND